MYSQSYSHILGEDWKIDFDRRFRHIALPLVEQTRKMISRRNGWVHVYLLYLQDVADVGEMTLSYYGDVQSVDQ